MLWRHSAGRVLVTLPDGELHLLDGTAAAAWELLDHPKTLDELVDRLLQLYDADEARVREDVNELLALLNQAGVVEAETASGTRPR